MLDAARRLFADRFGRAPVVWTPVAADGSQRRLIRMFGVSGETAIAVHGPDPEENRAFLSFTCAFRGLGLPVPEILGVDEAEGVYLESDLGDVTLFRALTEARQGAREAFPAAILPAYRRTLELLTRFQVEGGKAVDFSAAYPRAAFDRPSMRWDLDYFKYHFLKLAHVRFNEDRLERDFDRLVGFLLEADASHFLYRDFQSRNVMLVSDEPWFIDYQGGRRGALPYDVASLLYDAKAEIPDAVREALLDHYLDALSERLEVDRDRFRTEYRGFVLIRIMQAMGAYGYRGFYERKAHFLRSVPPAVANLSHILAARLLPLDLPELTAVFERIVSCAALREAPESRIAPLVVTVGSFAYARGLPDDPNGHGGGFVFDCRAIPNPGQSKDFAPLCGLDPDVAAFLDAQAATPEFLAHSLALVEAQVRAYLHRGFTSLAVHFGCTGGQHRSPYFAERLARGLRERFPSVSVVVTHRERDRWPQGLHPAANSAVLAWTR